MVSCCIESSDVVAGFSYNEGKLTITLSSESRGGTTSFTLDEYTTDKIKAMLFMLDETLQQAKERQAKKSRNRSLWDEAKKRAGPCSWKTKEFYEQLKAEKTSIEKELSGAGRRDDINI